jgi:hypothetical protein
MTQDTSTPDRANDLYWGSGAGVNELAERLDLSKGALYGMIRPLAAGVTCPECGAEMEYANRTARDKGFVTCGSCGMEEEEALVRVDAGERLAPIGADLATGRRYLGRTLVATALLGAAAGFALGRTFARD